MEARKATRRRGAALDQAILGAAWSELVERGYAEFTLEAVALRAGTSRPVLSRRWTGRKELAKAALTHQLEQQPVSVPDLGSVRDELVSLLQQLAGRGHVLIVVMAKMAGYLAETNSSLEDLRRDLAKGTIDHVLKRGVERGEVDASRLTRRITALPIDLIRHEMMMNMKPIEASVVEEIVDDIFMPLVRTPAR